MKKANNVELAQALLSRLTATKQIYGRLFEALDKFIPDNDQLSLNQMAFIMNQCYNVDDSRAVIVATAMAQWRVYKKIYNFDQDLLEMIFDQKCMDSIMKIKADSDFFKKLPFNGLCMYDSINSNVIIVTLEKDTCDDDVLMFYYLDYQNLVSHNSANGMMTFNTGVVKLYKNMTIEEALSQDFDNPLEMEKHIETYKRLISMLAYILSSNADISKSDKTINTYRKGDNKVIKDKFREIEEMDVGIHIGSAVRMHKSKYKSNLSSSKSARKSMCPHIRCGHYHSFWTGKRNSNNRSLIVKWIPPTFINSDKSVNVTVNKTIL